MVGPPRRVCFANHLFRTHLFTKISSSSKISCIEFLIQKYLGISLITIHYLS